MATIASPQAMAVRPVQAESASLRRELGIRDLFLAQILIVIVPEFFGTAVKAGAAHLAFWLLAILLFFIPQAVVVGYLNRLMPLEGGLFEWARIAFSDWMGFLVAWNVWLTATIQVAQVALVTTTYATYATGGQGTWVASDQRILLGLSTLLIALMMLVARVGLRVGKWVSNVGSFFTVLIIVFLAAMPFVSRLTGKLPAYHPLQLARPAMTLFGLSVFAKMTFGALSGFDTVAIFAGESKSPARNFARATFLAVPIIALLYIFGTSAILAYVSPEAIDIIGPIPQALSLGVGPSSWGSRIASIAILLLLTNYLCTYVTLFSANARLPMVAGWDHLLPRWFTKLDERYRTPVNSILFMGVVALAASAAASAGVGSQEAFAMLQIWTWSCYALAYLAMFAIPLLAAKKLALQPGIPLRIAAGCGFLVTVSFVLLSVSPIIAVQNLSAYTLKTVAFILGTNAFALFLYFVNRRKPRTDLQLAGRP